MGKTVRQIRLLGSGLVAPQDLGYRFPPAEQCCGGCADGGKCKGLTPAGPPILVSHTIIRTNSQLGFDARSVVPPFSGTDGTVCNCAIGTAYLDANGVCRCDNGVQATPTPPVSHPEGWPCTVPADGVHTLIQRRGHWNADLGRCVLNTTATPAPPGVSPAGGPAPGLLDGEISLLGFEIPKTTLLIGGIGAAALLYFSMQGGKSK